MTTLDAILSQAVLRADAIRDRVTGGASVLGKSGPARSGTITVVGGFSAPWATAAEEIEAIRSGDQWSPAEADFVAVATKSRSRGGRGAVPVVASSEALIYLILEQRPQSIGRLNVLTHGNTTTIGLGGEVISGNVLFDDELDVDVLKGLLEHGIIFKGRKVDWSEVEGRFADDAVIAIYACHAGMAKGFMQQLADFFDVRVEAFTHELQYRYPPNALAGGTIRRNLITVDGVGDFMDLAPGIKVEPALKDPFK